MRKYFAKELVLSILAALILSACNSGGGGGGGATDTTNVGETPEGQPIDSQSCVYQANDGASVDMQSLGQYDIVETAFGKKLNSAWLKAVAKASIVEGIKYIGNTEAEVYRTRPLNDKKCSRNLFQTANRPPADIQANWDEVIGSIKEGTLLGLYLPKTADDISTPSLKQKAAILVRINTSKWTLVHEFMHHLFMVEAVHEGYDNGQDRQDLQSAYKEFQAINNDYYTPAEDLLAKKIANYKKFSKAFASNLVHYTLEEMTVEKTLKEMLASKDLTFAPASSNWYLQSNGDKGLEIITEFKKLGDGIIAEAKYSSRPDNKNAVPELNAVMAMWTDMESEIDSIMTKYPKNYTDLGSIALTDSGIEIHEGCSHEAKTDELLKIARGLNRH